MEPAVEPSIYRRRRGLAATIWQTRGPQRWLLIIGLGITLFFIVLAIFAPLISPYGFDQYRTA